MRDPTVETKDDVAPPPERDPANSHIHDVPEPPSFKSWVESNSERITARWVSEVTNRLERRSEPVLTLLTGFYGFFLQIVAESFGPYREQVDPLWRQTARLYGDFGAKRALAAGEVIEEVQILRDAIIRRLFADPPADASALLSLRQVLRLNRLLDRAITHASVGYTDALFFALLEGPGVSESITPELLAEVGDQLEQLRSEFRDVMRSFPG